jgi:hypothetical protein
MHSYLVGGFNPSEKYCQLGCLFPIYGKTRNVPNHQPDICAFPKMGLPQQLDDLFHGKSENKMDGLGVPPF